jgi:hypothetical protein
MGEKTLPLWFYRIFSPFWDWRRPKRLDRLVGFGVSDRVSKPWMATGGHALRFDVIVSHGSAIFLLNRRYDNTNQSQRNSSQYLWGVTSVLISKGFDSVIFKT